MIDFLHFFQGGMTIIALKPLNHAYIFPLRQKTDTSNLEWIPNKSLKERDWGSRNTLVFQLKAEASLEKEDLLFYNIPTV